MYMAKTWMLVVMLFATDYNSNVMADVTGCRRQDIDTFNCTSANITSFPTRAEIPYGTISLDLSYNSLINVPHVNMSSPKTLLHLNLSRNLIASVRLDAFRDLTSLLTLDLSYNQLQGSALIVEEFRLEMTDFHRLRELNLRGNPLGLVERLTFTNFGYEYLEVLDLSYCGIATLEHLALSNLMRLKTLDLSHNNLETFDTAAIFGLTRLESLDLSYNKLIVVRDMHLTMTSSLHVINLDNNRIVAIKDNAFSGVTGLKNVTLRNNHIRHVTPLSIPWNKVMWPGLSGNPWTCDCNMRWFLNQRINASIM